MVLLRNRCAIVASPTKMIMVTGTGPRFPPKILINLSDSIEMLSLPVNHNPNPFVIFDIARVTIKEGIPIRVTIAPFTNPIAREIAMMTIEPSKALFSMFITVTPSTAEIIIVPGGEKSIFFEISGNEQPIAKRPKWLDCIITFVRFLRVKKPLTKIERKMNNINEIMISIAL